MSTAILTLFTLVAFAANSLLCRAALGGELIDPYAFTAVRVLSGAAILLPLARLASDSGVPEPAAPGGTVPRPPARLGSEPRTATRAGSWGSGVALFVYAAAFSLAYVSLETGMGALLLFAAVQATMLGAGVAAGERPSAAQWLGLAVAFAGLVYLVSPGIAAPDPLGAALMIAAGVAWGIYSMRGKGVATPTAMTAGNFLRAAPLAAGLGVLALPRLDVAPAGALLALVSGAVTSGLGYVLWYRVLRRITTTRAAILQLLTPLLAAFGGVALLGERFTPRLAVASLLILGGVALAVLRQRPMNRSRQQPEALPRHGRPP